MLKVEPLRYGITLSGNKSDTQQMWTIISESDQRVNTKDLRNEQLPVNFINWHWIRINGKKKLSVMLTTAARVSGLTVTVSNDSVWYLYNAF